MDRELTTFGVFQIGMTSVDVGTDGVQAYDYYKNENYWWGTSTVTIMFLPLVTSLVTEVLNNLIKYCHGDEVSWKESFRKIGRHFPLAQTVVHLTYFLSLRSAKNTVIKAHKFYKTFDPNDVSTKNGIEVGEDEVQSRRVYYRSEIEKAASAYVEAKEAYTKNLTEFQELKLYEAFGEAAPQAVLQFSIILQLGYISPLQIVTIITSLFSFSLASSEIFLMMKTKRKLIKTASWKETFLIVLPAMFLIVVPRILSLSVIAAYTKQHFVVFIAVMVITNIIINAQHFKRDPAQTFLGITTNIFSPCILIDEGSGFYRRSGITSSILHVICQIILFCLVVGEAISPCPNFEKNIFSPIMHCYPGNLNISTIARCDGDFLTSSDCTLDTNLAYFNFNVSTCTDEILPIQWSLEENSSKRVTYCGDIPWWIPIFTTSLILILCQILGIVIIMSLLSKIADPIAMYRVSKSCFPSNRCCKLDPVWNEEDKTICEHIDRFLTYPSMDFLKGGNLIEKSIENDFHEIILLAIENDVLKIDRALLKTVVDKGSRKTIKILLQKLKDDGKINKLDDEANFDLEVLEKTLQSLTKQPKAIFSIKEPVFSLQKYCGLSSIQQQSS